MHYLNSIEGINRNLYQCTPPLHLIPRLLYIFGPKNELLLRYGGMEGVTYGNVWYRFLVQTNWWIFDEKKYKISTTLIA